MDPTPTQKSYQKSKTIRKLNRTALFQQHRSLTTPSASSPSTSSTSSTSTPSYLPTYSPEQQNKILASLQCPLPEGCQQSVPVLGEVTRENISLWRRIGKPVWKTSVDGIADLHMMYESLWGLAGVDDIQQYQSYQNPLLIVQEFQDNLPFYLSLPYPEISELATIASGNRVLGKPQHILSLTNSSSAHLWILINHIYQHRLPLTALLPYLTLPTPIPIVYRTLYEMTNAQQDEAVLFVVRNEVVLESVMRGIVTSCEEEEAMEVQGFCVKIVGNLLGEKQDYSDLLTSYNLLDKVNIALKQCQTPTKPQHPNCSSLKKHKAQLKKNLLFLLSNYTSSSPSTLCLLHHKPLLQRILLLMHKTSPLPIKLELYRIVCALLMYGPRAEMYRLCKEEGIVERCSVDIEVDDIALTGLVLTVLAKIVEIGDQFGEEQDEDENMGELGIRNEVVMEISRNSKLKAYINSKTFSKNQNISNMSLQILTKVEDYESKYGEQD